LPTRSDLYKIKEILSDKIKERKITERWIEKCLPAEYKGKYDKSELSSLSGRTKRIRKRSLSQKSVELDRLVLENSELKEALRRQTTLLSADQVSVNEIVYAIPKVKFEQIRVAMETSTNSIQLVFDKAGVLERAEPDTYQGNLKK
jgi:seryl-tRNA synthetase